MSYENTACPCGNKKPINTMLCDSCLAQFSSHPATTDMNNAKLPVEVRRHAAITLVTLSRRRQKDFPKSILAQIKLNPVAV
jgi:hypothetical protein